MIRSMANAGAAAVVARVLSAPVRLLVLGMCAAAATVHGAEFPNRPFRVVVSEGPGSGSDLVARLVGNMLTEAFGQPAVIDGRPGASGLIGAEAAAKAPADGYTVWVASTSQLMGTTMHQRYLMSEEFAPVTLLATTASIMTVTGSLPVNTIPEMIAYVKARPGQMMYGSAGQGTGMHMCMELFSAMTGIKAVHVPYKGSPPMLTDMAGGHLQIGCVPAAPLQPFLKGGRIRALAVTTAGRTALAPGLPPVSDSVPGFESTGWYGLLAPLGTPDDIVAQLHAAVVKALKTPAIQEKLSALGSEAAGTRPAEFAAFLKSQSAKWAKVLRDANIKPID
jgi:tripartite-type tricarboxylate transporter receptor subunit TctC